MFDPRNLTANGYEYSELVIAAREFKEASDALRDYTASCSQSGRKGPRLPYLAAYNLSAAHANDALLKWYDATVIPWSEP